MRNVNVALATATAEEPRPFALFRYRTWPTGPLGGWQDFAGFFASVDEALERVQDPSLVICPYWHVVDLRSGLLVAASHPDFRQPEVLS
jgi:hypothetical protein